MQEKHCAQDGKTVEKGGLQKNSLSTRLFPQWDGGTTSGLAVAERGGCSGVNRTCRQGPGPSRGRNTTVKKFAMKTLALTCRLAVQAAATRNCLTSSIRARARMHKAYREAKVAAGAEKVEKNGREQRKFRGGKQQRALIRGRHGFRKVAVGRGGSSGEGESDSI